MQTITAYLFRFFIRLGGCGLLGLGILDTSFLFMPLGNDLLVVAMSARRHQMMLYYAAMASAGSVLGAALIDVIFRKGGEAGLDKHVPSKRLEPIKRRVRRRAAWASGVASLMPPPFPFTPFLMAASALEYPRKKLLTVVGIFRMVRFTVEGLLAVRFGTYILRLAEAAWLQIAIIALIVLCMGGSIWSVFHWARRAGRPA